MRSEQLCIVFDLDDTLYSERDFVRSGFEAAGAWAFKNLGLEGLAETAWDCFETGKRGKIFDLALQQLGVHAELALVSELVSVYRRHFPEIAPASDVVPVLSGLRSYANLAVITDGPPYTQRNKLAALGIADLFDLIIVTDEIGLEYRKPHRRPFELVEQYFRATGERCVYVADNPAKDFIAPRQMHWKSFRIRRAPGLYSKSDNGSNKADFAIHDLTEIPKLLSGCGSYSYQE